MEDELRLEMEAAEAERHGLAFDRNAARQRLRDSAARQDRIHARYIDHLSDE
jgi:hypothetical protein